MLRIKTHVQDKNPVQSVLLTHSFIILNIANFEKRALGLHEHQTEAGSVKSESTGN